MHTRLGMNDLAFLVAGWEDPDWLTFPAGNFVVIKKPAVSSSHLNYLSKSSFLMRGTWQSHYLNEALAAAICIMLRWNSTFCCYLMRENSLL